MRTRSIVAITTLLIIGLLWPTGAWARRVAVGGSLTIIQAAGPLTTQLVVLSVTSNRGLEKVVTQQLPLPGALFVVPFFVNKDKSHDDDGDLDTLLTLTNTTGAPLDLILTLRGLDGSVLTVSTPSTLSAHETRVIVISDLL